MATETDPAREFVEVCENLSGASKYKGDEHLARQFGVTAWSTEFYQIIFCIIERADFLASVIDRLQIDEELKADAKNHIGQMKAAFSREAITGNWEVTGHKYLQRANTQPIKMLSPLVKKLISYPKLDAKEIDELVLQIEELQGWLQSAQLVENDFIRQSIIEGLSILKFRLQKIGWLGWGYTVESLQKVIGAYLALERNLPADHSDPVAKALLLKVGALVKDIYAKADAVKSGVEMVDFALRVYATLSLARDIGVAGLLTKQ